MDRTQAIDRFGGFRAAPEQMARLNHFRRGHRFAVAMGVMLVALLGLAVPLRLESMREVSDAQLLRSEHLLFDATHDFVEAFNAELTRALLYFGPVRPVPGEKLQTEQRLAHQFDIWRSTSPYPELVKALWVEQMAGQQRSSIGLLDVTLNEIQQQPWPRRFEPIQMELEARRTGYGGSDREPGTISILQDRVPAIVIPLRTVTRHSRRDRHSQRDCCVEAHVIVELDAVYITTELLPALFRRHLRSIEGTSYQVAVLSQDGPYDLIFSSDEDFHPEVDAAVDMSHSLFGFVDDRQYRELMVSVGLHLSLPQPNPDEAHGGDGERHSKRTETDLVLDDAHHEWGRWKVLVRHPSGSLKRAFEQRRQRTILLNLGLLALLGTTAFLLVLSSQRAQKLARQQVGFVTGVSHELLTPLSVIRMAARNLERGTIEERAGVKRYAALIGREEHRLTEMVERVLAFGQIQTGDKTYSMQPLLMREIIDAALGDCQLLVAEQGANVEVRLAEEDLSATGDADALRQAVQNLIANALKHAGPSPYVVIEVEYETSAKQPEIAIAVTDSGPGIAAEELPHILEPFHRGRRAVEEQIQGSGLGLALVKEIIEAHGGRVTVTSDETGSRFTLNIPAAVSDNPDE